ncbi:MAG: hypothetical protein V1668_03475 [Patescibacteria group bacterium]
MAPNPEIPTPPPEAVPQEEKQTLPAMEYGELTEEEKRKMEIVESQFNNPQFVEIDAPGVEGKKLKIEYVILDARNQDDLARAQEMNERTVIHIPGFGSSYRANEQYEKLMAVKEKKRVIIISQPSTGGSDNAPQEWRKWSRTERSFEPFADVVDKTLEAIRQQEEQSGRPLTTPELSISSSSMGSIIAVDFAVKHPDQVKDLVLMHPGGVNEESVLALASRYFPETIGGKGGVKAVIRNFLPNRRSNKPTDELDPVYIEKLKQAYADMAGKSTLKNKNMRVADSSKLHEIPGASIEESYQLAGGQGDYNFLQAERQDKEFRTRVGRDIAADSKVNTVNKEGLKWRIWEAFTIAKGGLLRQLPHIKANTYVVFGNKDQMFPAEQMGKVTDALTNAPTVMTDTFQTRHDDIYGDARKYTASVGGFFDKMREKEKVGQ